jgi:hypothetical protein
MEWDHAVLGAAGSQSSAVRVRRHTAFISPSTPLRETRSNSLSELMSLGRSASPARFSGLAPASICRARDPTE